MNASSRFTSRWQQIVAVHQQLPLQGKQSESSSFKHTMKIHAVLSSAKKTNYLKIKNRRSKKWIIRNLIYIQHMSIRA